MILLHTTELANNELLSHKEMNMKYNLNDEVWFWNGNGEGYNDKGIVVDYYRFEGISYYVIKVEYSEDNFELVLKTEEQL